MSAQPISAEPRHVFVDEVDAVRDQLVYACSELGKAIRSRNADATGLIEAQANALASLEALSTIASRVPANGLPARATRPQSQAGSLAQQLGQLRQAVVQVVDLVEHMPGIDRHLVATRRQLVVTLLGVIETEARRHQPSKARQ